MKLKCNCRVHYIFLGIGRMYHQTSREELERARNGELGSEIQAAAKGKKYLAIDAVNRFYYCSQCGYWEVSGSHDLYELKKQKIFGAKTFEGDLSDYNLVFKYKHICPECNTEMTNPETIDKRVLSKIRCQECGSFLEHDLDGMIMWD